MAFNVFWCVPAGATDYIFITMPYKLDSFIVDEPDSPSFAHSM